MDRETIAAIQYKRGFSSFISQPLLIRWYGSVLQAQDTETGLALLYLLTLILVKRDQRWTVEATTTETGARSWVLTIGKYRYEGPYLTIGILEYVRGLGYWPS